MKPTQIRRFLKKHKFMLGAMLKRNPVMLLGVSLPFVIATATSLRAAAAMSLEMLLVSLVGAVAAVLTAGRLEAWVRAAVNVAATTLTVMAVRVLLAFLFPDIANFLGIYIYLMALNGVVLFQADRGGRTLRGNLVHMLRSAGVHTLAFAVFMFVVALPRELLGNGTLWGVALPVPFRLQGMRLPFFGFICVGFLLAVVKFLSKQITFFRAVEDARREARDRARYTEIRVEPVE